MLSGFGLRVSCLAPQEQVDLSHEVAHSVSRCAVGKRRFAPVEQPRHATLHEGFDIAADLSLDNLLKTGNYVVNVELKKLADSSLSATGDSDAPSLSGLDNLARALRKAIDLEINRLEARLIFLATVGSTGPFIGLFGTVWGIMGSFQRIGQTGMASLAVVAPGIAEALIATGIGLAAAIPATIAYNHYINLIKKQELVLNNFASDFLNLAK